MFSFIHLFICILSLKELLYAHHPTHSMSHRAVTPLDEHFYICDIDGCDQTFAHKWSLKRHMRTHLGQVTHSCNVCGLGFVQKCSRDRHQATHSNKKKFVGWQTRLLPRNE